MPSSIQQKAFIRCEMLKRKILDPHAWTLIGSDQGLDDSEGADRFRLRLKDHFGEIEQQEPIMSDADLEEVSDLFFLTRYNRFS